MFTDRSEQTFAAMGDYKDLWGKAVTHLPPDCRGCVNDPTYDEAKRGVICKTKGCDGQSKYKARFSTQSHYNRKHQGKLGA
jgi:hypothetical protein